MARKVFISVLGTGPYSECTYASEGFTYTTRYIQAATIKLLMDKAESGNAWGEKDAVIVFTTQKAYENQWIVGKVRMGNVETSADGLEAVFKKMNLPMPVNRKDIDDGQNETEIWNVFKAIYNKIEEGDELYIDITHAYRYLPMLLLVLVNYAKFLKHISVKSITYGNYVVKEELKPIMDLTSLSSLQDWTYASGQYLEYGNADNLVQLAQNELRPILKATHGKDTGANNMRYFMIMLKDLVDERRTCRGVSIIKSETLRKLKELSKTMDQEVISAMAPVIKRVKESLSDFDESENIKNGISAAKWCFDNGLFQQSVTILQEAIISMMCFRNGLAIEDKDVRDIVSAAFKIKGLKWENDEKMWKIDGEEEKTTLRLVLSDELFTDKTFVGLFSSLTEVRNDFNHSGMRSGSLAPKNIKERISDCLNKIFDICW